MTKATCPICGRAMDVEELAAWPQFPFCSARCKTIDLGRWLSDRYAIPREGEGEADMSDEGEAE
jgi:endogenous inhibitor of DNA gyrase (YacG/DUF329 family)